jgi:hypothetical protein
LLLWGVNSHQNHGSKSHFIEISSVEVVRLQLISNRLRLAQTSTLMAMSGGRLSTCL